MIQLVLLMPGISLPNHLDDKAKIYNNQNLISENIPPESETGVDTIQVPPIKNNSILHKI